MGIITQVKENLRYFRSALKRPELSRGDRLFSIIDMPYSAIMHGATPKNYVWFDFYKLNDHDKRKFLTDPRALRLYKKSNGKGDVSVLDNKKTFNRVYGDYVKRPWRDVNELSLGEFRDFVADCGDVIIKPYDKSWGVGVCRYSYSGGGIEEAYASAKDCIVEKYIVQHPTLAAFNPDCVNSLRLVTYVCDDGKPGIVAALLRIGAQGKCADNVANGGSVAEIDVKTGLVFTPSVDDMKHSSIYAPTGVKVLGTRIPHWRRIVDAVLEAAMLKPELRLVGWDVAVTEEGYEFIEGNSCPSIQLMQMASCTGRRDVNAAAMKNRRAAEK